jgi:hypothetical protein
MPKIQGRSRARLAQARQTAQDAQPRFLDRIRRRIVGSGHAPCVFPERQMPPRHSASSAARSPS